MKKRKKNTKDQEVILEAIKENPNIRFGIQKSMRLNFADLPLFSEEEKQVKLF
jgi:hypothetical protein